MDAGASVNFRRLADPRYGESGWISREIKAPFGEGPFTVVQIIATKDGLPPDAAVDEADFPVCEVRNARGEVKYIPSRLLEERDL